MTAPSDRVTAALVDFAFAMKARAPDAAQRRALVDRVVDILACAAAAAREPEIAGVGRAVREHAGAGDRDVLLHGKAPLAEAVFLNSFMVRYLDWNDTYIGKNGGHPSDIFAGALTVAGALRKSGDDALRAIAAGQHVMLDLCDSADAFARGWDHATYTGLAATVAIGLLFDLDRSQLASAISLTAVSNNMLISRSGKIATWKGLAAPAALRAAFNNCVLARAGVTGPDPVFEGDFGFERHVSGPLAPELDARRDRTGDTHLKLFPAVYHAQAPIELGLRLRARLIGALGAQPSAALVDRIDVTTYAFALKWAADGANKWRPANRETADHSLPFMLAMALVRGDVDHDNLGAAIHDPAIVALTQKVAVVADADMSAKWPKLSPARVRVSAGGQVFEEEALAHTGHVTRPMASETLDGKLVAAATPAIGEARARAWAARARQMADAPDIAGLLAP